MDIYLHNTLTGKKEKFEPIKKGKVGMYHCGPTVYNYPHIGNLRAYVFADTIKRLFLYSGYKVKQVINITDVGHIVNDADSGEDKMEKARKREQKSAYEIAEFYTNVFFENLKDLNIDTKGTKFPRATKYIKSQIKIVKTLEKKGFTYKTSDGIYFDTSKFQEYGKLGNIDIKGIREGERIGINDEKKNPTDFALWKFSPTNEKREMEWSSPWGVGFPGWHIECSTMSSELLGDTFDIHTGGIDHIPVHHNNEIAQSESSTGKHFVNYWLHSAFINIDGAKMAKSEDNFLTLQKVIDRGISPLAYRYFLLTARYSTPLNFSWEALEGASSAYKKLRNLVSSYSNKGKISKEYVNKVNEIIIDDLDTPKVIALIWDITKDSNLSDPDKKATIVEIDRLLGLKLGEKIEETKIPENVLMLANKRDEARKVKDWKKSDELRDEIANLGFEVKDTSDGQKLIKK